MFLLRSFGENRKREGGDEIDSSLEKLLLMLKWVINAFCRIHFARMLFLHLCWVELFVVVLLTALKLIVICASHVCAQWPIVFYRMSISLCLLSFYTLNYYFYLLKSLLCNRWLCEVFFDDYRIFKWDFYSKIDFKFRFFFQNY